MGEPYINRELFGGAITAKTAADLVDASDFRQVPDNQEVFMYSQSNASIIVEVLQAVDEETNFKAIRFHFDSLAHDNAAEISEVQDISVVPNDRGDVTPSPVVLHGMQTVRKFNRGEPDTVKILMALYRVEQKRADLVVTFNIPTKSEGTGVVAEAQVQKLTEDFEEFVRSLVIEDFGLFV